MLVLCKVVPSCLAEDITSAPTRSKLSASAQKKRWGDGGGGGGGGGGAHTDSLLPPGQIHCVVFFTQLQNLDMFHVKLCDKILEGNLSIPSRKE